MEVSTSWKILCISSRCLLRCSSLLEGLYQGIWWQANFNNTVSRHWPGWRCYLTNFCPSFLSVQSNLEQTAETRKLITFHLYNPEKASPSVLIQGHDTMKWVQKEFDRVRCLVHNLDSHRDDSATCLSVCRDLPLILPNFHGYIPEQKCTHTTPRKSVILSREEAYWQSLHAHGSPVLPVWTAAAATSSSMGLVALINTLTATTTAFASVAATHPSAAAATAHTVATTTSATLSDTTTGVADQTSASTALPDTTSDLADQTSAFRFQHHLTLLSNTNAVTVPSVTNAPTAPSNTNTTAQHQHLDSAVWHQPAPHRLLHLLQTRLNRPLPLPQRALHRLVPLQQPTLNRPLLLRQPALHRLLPLEHLTPHSTRQSPPALRLPKEGRLSVFPTGDSNLRHVDRKRLDNRGNLHIWRVGGATAGDTAACLLNQSLRADTKHVIVHIGTNDCSRDSDYNKQLVTVSFQALAKQLVRVFPRAAVAFTSILPKRSGHKRATEEANKILKDVRSSCGFELLHHLLLGDSSQTFQKQLYSDEVHLTQRGLATLLRSIIAFLSRSQGGCSPIPKERQQHSVRGKCQALRCCGKGRWSWPAEKRIGFSASVTQHATTARLTKKNGPCAAAARPSGKSAAPASWQSWPWCWSAPHAVFQWQHSGGPPLPPSVPPFPFQSPWNFNPYHPWTPHFPHQHLLQTPPPPHPPNYPWWS